jgi:hypothetical protein
LSRWSASPGNVLAFLPTAQEEAKLQSFWPMNDSGRAAAIEIA